MECVRSLRLRRRAAARPIGRATLGAWFVHDRTRELSALRTVRHPQPEELEVTDVLHALSDPVRLEIVRNLAESDERCCNALHAEVSKSTLSHHLKVLREAGITRTRMSGTQRLVSLRDTELEACMPGLLPSVLRAAEGSTTVGASVSTP